MESVDAAPGDPEASPQPSPPAGQDDGTVIVDVAGRVRRPGIVTLPLGSRVVDAIRAAGGARESVDLTSLNLARELVDGEQLLVGLAPPPAVPTPGGVPGTAGPVGLVNLNTATMAELDTLPGVGPVTAQAILDWRAANGSFTSVDELLEVDGIGDATLADLRDLVTV
jgi:competence protein ComEA